MNIFISADDMGLGKTLTMISLVLKTKEKNENEVVHEEDASSEEGESESSWFPKKRKCKFHYPIQLTYVYT
jgi:transcription termination factor 2